MKQLLVFFFLLPAWGLRAQAPVVQINYITDIPDAHRNIVYDPARPLTISDFQGKPDPSSDAVAITSSGFRFNAGFRRSGNKATLQIGVYCSFDRQESWMKEKGKDPHILEHEQHHFNISYLHTLRFMDKLRRLKLKEDGFMEQIKDLYYESVAELEAMQKAYDRETGHGIHKEEQHTWNKRISGELTRLEPQVR